MAKPATFDGYSDQYTVDWERVLVTLQRGLGPWKESVYLIGGLTPRYATKPDFDNYAKTVDALNLIVWVDDGQIVDARIRKVYSETPGMTIRVDHYKGEMFS